MHAPSAIAEVALDRLVGAIGLAVFVGVAGAALPTHILLAALAVAAGALVAALVVRKYRPDLVPRRKLPSPSKIIHGVVLSLARSLGEFGALKIVSGNLTGQTQTAPLVVEQKYQNFAQGEAYAVSFILVLISVLCIVVVSLLRPKESSS